MARFAERSSAATEEAEPTEQRDAPQLEPLAERWPKSSEALLQEEPVLLLAALPGALEGQ